VIRIACAGRRRCSFGEHIVSVGLAEEGTVATVRLSVAAVYELMDRGEQFCTYNEWHPAAMVCKDRCPCGGDTLRSTPDSIEQVRLDRLCRCRGGGDWEGDDDRGC
jgi:hypothetical protein